MPKRWTPIEESALFNESSKHSIEQLAKKYGVTPKSVAVKLQKLRQAMRKTGASDVLSIPRQRASVGGEAKRWTPDEEVELLDLHRKGWKTEKIATHFGVSQKAISVKLLKVKKKNAQTDVVVQTTQTSATRKAVQTSVKAEIKPSAVKTPQKAPEPVHKPLPSKPTTTPSPAIKPMHQTGNMTSSKHQEGEANTQFKVWNGTEWITIKVPKRIIHV
jgi:hypothetical protein